MEHLLSALALIALTVSNTLMHPPVQKPQEELKAQTEELEALQPIQTKSEFQTKTESITIKIPREIKQIEDSEKEAGIDEVLDEGEDGKITKVYKITLINDTEYDREEISNETINPKTKIISKGTKIVWKMLSTQDGEIRYWKKLRVYATHYDSHCPGCDETTAIGLRAGKGVIAVDPSVIKLRSEVYIPGYGKAIAGDTGGAIKGNIIDLGFDDARTAGWYAHFVDIYLQ